MYQSDMIDMRGYGVYQFRWYIRHHKDFTQHRTTECIFLTDIKYIKQDGTLGNFLPERPFRVNGFLQRYQTYVWYQDDTSLEEHRLVGTLKFGTTEINKLKYPIMIDKKKWNELEK